MTDRQPGAPHGGASDMELSAWLDGGLDKDRVTAMEGLLAWDANSAMRAERFRHVDSLVRAAVPMEDSVPDALLERLGLSGQAGGKVVDLAAVRARRAQAQVRPSRWFAGAGLTRAAAGVTLAAGLGIASLVLTPNRPVDLASGETRGDYTTLSDASRPVPKITPNAIAMFAHGTAPARARAIITASGASIVSGPTAGDVWQLAITAGHEPAVLSGLRAHPEVTLAEHLDGARP